MSKLYVISRANNGHYIVQRIRLNTSPDQDHAMYIELAGCCKRPADLREMSNTAKQYDCSLYLITIEGCR